jgi:hypothetical protein
VRDIKSLHVSLFLAPFVATGHLFFTFFAGAPITTSHFFTGPREEIVKSGGLLKLTEFCQSPDRRPDLTSFNGPIVLAKKKTAVGRRAA